MTRQTLRCLCAKMMKRMPFSSRFAKDSEGMAAVEFSFILPIMVLLWLGGSEMTLMLGTDRKVIGLASAIGDITSRSKEITHSQVDSLFGLATPSMYPQSADDTEMIITAVDMDNDGNATVTWSRTQNGTAYSAGATMNSKIPAALRVPDTQIIMAEVLHPHLPRIGYRITGTVDLEKTMFFTPRVSETVKLCNNAGNNCI